MSEIRAQFEQPQAPPRGRLISQSPMRMAVAQQMTESKHNIPHFYVSVEIQMDRVLNVIGRLSGRESASARVSVTACMIRVLAQTLLEYEAFNSAWTPHGFAVPDGVHVGVAIALADGVVAPALLDCQQLDLLQTAAALEDLVSRTRAGRLRASELASATFTLSNLGMFDVAAFAAIVVPPQVAILATGRAARRPVVDDAGDIVVRSVMTATLSCDHRLVDGAQAARFLQSFKARLESLDERASATPGATIR